VPTGLRGPAGLTEKSALAEPRQCHNFIGGTFDLGKKAARPVVSPWNGAVIGHVVLSDAGDVARAVQKASAAFPDWRQTPVKERAQHLFKFRNLVLQQIDRLAGVTALESGKTAAEAAAGIMKGLEVTEFALSLQNLDDGGLMEVSRGVTCEVRREPLGVVAGIAPFNFPAMVPMWMYPIALALGNCFILKPSEKVPLTSSLFAELIGTAGFPPGVFSLVNGEREAAQALVDHPDVKAIGFVGSTPAARAVYARATSLGKRALCLGGAKNYLLVTPDADPDLTARGVVDSFTGCAGQRCMAASLMIAVGDVDHIIKKIVDVARSVRLGETMGAIIDKAALERIRTAVRRASQDGARVILDGTEAQAPEGGTGGNWVAPSIIDHASPTMACSCDEIFGPVLTIVRVKTVAEAMKLEQANPFGNATSVFTSSGAVARYVATHATNGMIGVNIGVPVPREPFSFGGTKESKFGHGDITGRSSLDFWSQLKKVTMKWQSQSDSSWMS